MKLSYEGKRECLAVVLDGRALVVARGDVIEVSEKAGRELKKLGGFIAAPSPSVETEEA